MKNQFKHSLMDNNILKQDLNFIIKFLKKKNIILTQSKYVKKFEENWSKWLGVKYSVFVNSGSSANILSLAVLKQFTRKKEIIVPSLTWVSDINAVTMNNFKPRFVDVQLDSLSMKFEDIKKKINKSTAAIFLTHAQGFNGLSNDLLKLIKDKKIILLEDVCESHGATYKNKKLGTFGMISNFSFYYAHHLTTIEGGMVCTNNKKVYEIAKIIRSHGMLRESGNKIYESSIIKTNPKLPPKFIFLYPGYNFRNNEIGAVLGLSQLKRLNKNNKIRSKNFKFFLKNLDSNKYFKDFKLEGSSNYAFPIILKTKNISKRNYFEKILKKNNIEFRRGNAGGGNQLRQPYLKNLTKKLNLKKFKNVEHIHFFGYYIGNYPTLTLEKVKKICNILNSIKI